MGLAMLSCPVGKVGGLRIRHNARREHLPAEYRPEQGASAKQPCIRDGGKLLLYLLFITKYTLRILLVYS